MFLAFALQAYQLNHSFFLSMSFNFGNVNLESSVTNDNTLFSLIIGNKNAFSNIILSNMLTRKLLRLIKLTLKK